MPGGASLTPGTSPGESARGLNTRAVHPPDPPRQSGVPIVPEIELASTYAFSDAEDFAKASQEKVGAGYVYTRWANRTVDRFEAAVADLEGAATAEAFATGMAAISTTLLALTTQGDRIVAARQLYGGTHSLITNLLPRYGITADTFDVWDHDGIASAVEGAVLLYCETIGNPRIRVADLARLSAIAHGAGIPLVVDSTFASPALCRPIEFGADVVVHSATKFLGGHHDLMGGIVCAEPRLIEKIAGLARELGPTLAPFNAWLALRGISTLPLRVARSSESAHSLASFLAGSDDIDGVSYPGLDGDPSKELCDSMLKGQGGGTLAFEVAGGRDRAQRFQDELRLIAPAASLGGTHSLIVHAASVTHTQLSSEQLEAAGISEGFCRLSVGLEDASDLIADIEGALERS